MHASEVEKMVLRLWDSGNYTKAQISKWFAKHYKGGYHIPHATVSNMIKTAELRRSKHDELDLMTAVALGKHIEPAKAVEQPTEAAPKTGGSFFVDEQIGGYEEREHKPPSKSAPQGKVVMAIPDLHCPFEHPDALQFLKVVRDTYRPDEIVCLGDEIDAHALSRYPKNPDMMSAGQEMKAARDALEKFYVAFPNVKVCESNHTVRGHKLACDSGIPSVYLRSIETILGYPDGWRLEQKHIIDNVLYIHGDSGKSGIHAAIAYMRQTGMSVVIGHIHICPSVFYEGDRFAMNASCLINRKHPAFGYAKKNLVPVGLGCGIIKNGKTAHFIPMHVDNDERWTGEL